MKNKKAKILFETSLSFFKRDLKVRYADSILGPVWIIFQPLMFTLITSVVFSLVFSGKTGNTPYFLYVMIGFVIWIFFSQSISQSTKSLVWNRELIANAKFPRESIVISTIASKFIDFFVNLSLFFVFFSFMHQSLSFENIPVIFVLIIIQITFQLGLALIISSLNVYYRDVQNVVDLLLQILFYTTPVLYPLSIIPDKFRNIIELNPITKIILAYRDLLFNQTVNTKSIFTTFLIATATLTIGILIFRKLEVKFADLI